MFTPLLTPIYQAVGDEAMARGVSDDNHPIKLPADNPDHCIVWGSHALMKLPYWDESGFKHPDPMHTISNEVRDLLLTSVPHAIGPR